MSKNKIIFKYSSGGFGSIEDSHHEILTITDSVILYSFKWDINKKEYSEHKEYLLTPDYFNDALPLASKIDYSWKIHKPFNKNNKAYINELITILKNLLTMEDKFVCDGDMLEYEFIDNDVSYKDMFFWCEYDEIRKAIRNWLKKFIPNGLLLPNFLK